MSTPGFAPLRTYACPYVDRCVAAVPDQAYFEHYCREVSQTPKDPNYLQCAIFPNMELTPLSWKLRIEKRSGDIGYSQSRNPGAR